jgi:hypothetical protein
VRLLSPTCWPQVELQLRSTNQNGELREVVKEDGVETRRTMEEFHKEMKDKVQAILASLQAGLNPDATSPQEPVVAEIVPKHSALPAGQVRN